METRDAGAPCRLIGECVYDRAVGANWAAVGGEVARVTRVRVGGNCTGFFLGGGGSAEEMSQHN